MRKLEFKEPNFKCEVVDAGNTLKDWLFYAENDKALRDLFATDFILRHYTLTKAIPYNFKDWEKKAADATKEAVLKHADKTFQFKDSIWGEIKQYLFFISKHRCGYCESNVRLTSSGAVEHYRPKKRVEEDKKHPGYFWLAYNYKNYVPCCTNCNSARGKMNHFPLATGSQRAESKRSMAKEQPLLLHPFVDEPSDHLQFDPATGKIEGITPAGKESEKIYQLNRGDLVGTRQRAFKLIVDRLKGAAAWEKMKDSILQELMNNECDFTFMVRAALNESLKEEKDRLNRLQQQIDADLKLLQ